MSREDLRTALATLDQLPVSARPELQASLFERLEEELARPRLTDRLLVPAFRRRAQVVLAAVAVGVAVVAAAGLLQVAGLLRDEPEPVIVDVPPSPPLPDPSPEVTDPNDPTEDTDPADPTEGTEDGSGDAAPDTALEVLLAARHRWLTAPRPLQATVASESTAEDGSVQLTERRVWVRDDRAWREEVSSPGFDVRTTWNAPVELQTTPSDDRATVFQTTWERTDRHVLGTPLTDWLESELAWTERCGTGEVLPEEVLVGRRAQHVRCGDEQLWFDAETGLLLRHERPAGVDVMDPAAATWAVTALGYDPAFADDLFDTTPDAGADLVRQEERFLLQPGDAAPPFDATTADGSSVTLDTLRGRPALIVWWSLGLFDLARVEEIHRAAPGGLQVVVYDDRREEAAAEEAATRERGFTVPLVFDASGSDGAGTGATIGERWRQGADPGGGEVGGATAQFWVLLDAEGTVVDRRHGDLLPEHLDAWLTGSAR